MIPAKLEPIGAKKKPAKRSPKIDNMGLVNTPIDYSFQEIKVLEDLRERDPNDDVKMRRDLAKALKRANRKELEKNAKKLPITAVKLAYNELTSIKGLDTALAEILEKPEDLRWLDLSYNKLTDIDVVLTKFPKLSMLYLHGNSIRDLNQVQKLKSLKNLKKLTLHGNQNVIDKGTRFLKMVKGSLKRTKAESKAALLKLPVSRIKEQCTLLKHFGLQYPAGNKEGAVKAILKFIYADITNHHYRPPATAETSMEDKKIITLEDIKNYRFKVISYVPSLNVLDYIGITPHERDQAWRQIGSRMKPEKKGDDDEEL
mmetsp:Transcript_41145/g.66169  ORF Transcript_41145/g.66169 Transcript_41145/m.66169 type:complete len:315 (+) Transcript_41145:81-1025(+)|eukprot:jgi/Bigna1/91224/estExt_fgenesh1_pg.C_930037